MSHEKVRIYVNPASQERYRNEAIGLSKKLPQATLHELRYPLESIPDGVETVIVVGGDGSVKGVMDKLFDRDNPGRLLIVPAGSQNGLHKTLVDAQSKITLEQLQDNYMSHIPHLRPGSVNGETFVHLADITKAGVLQIEYVEAMRKTRVPRKARAYAALVPVIFAIKRGEDYPTYGFDVFYPGPYIGAIKISPGQNIYDNNLTHISMQAKNKIEWAIKSGALFFYMLTLGGKTPPETIAKITSKQSFELNAYGTEINVDGEIKPLPKTGTIFVARDKRSLPIAALSLKEY